MPGPDGQQAAGGHEDVRGRGCLRRKGHVVGRCDDASRFTRKAEKAETGFCRKRVWREEDVGQGKDWIRYKATPYFLLFSLLIRCRIRTERSGPCGRTEKWASRHWTKR